MNIDELTEIVEKIKNLFGENELAYLSLTSKNESVIRDKIAYKLYSELDKSKYVISREYKTRVDLAILKNNSTKDKIELRDIIELKSMYTFDAEKGLEEYFQKVNHDFKKNDKLLEKNVNKYAIIIATHPKVSVSTLKKKFKDVIKYYIDIKRYIEKQNSLKDSMDEKIRNKFKMEDGYNIRECEINAGQAFNIEVYVYFWIIQKTKW